MRHKKKSTANTQVSLHEHCSEDVDSGTNGIIIPSLKNAKNQLKVLGK